MNTCMSAEKQSMLRSLYRPRHIYIYSLCMHAL